MAPAQKRKAGAHTLADLNKTEKKPKLSQLKKANGSKKGKVRTLKEIAKKKLQEDDDFMVSQLPTCNRAAL